MQISTLKNRQTVCTQLRLIFLNVCWKTVGSEFFKTVLDNVQ